MSVKILPVLKYYHINEQVARANVNNVINVMIYVWNVRRIIAWKTPYSL